MKPKASLRLRFKISGICCVDRQTQALQRSAVLPSSGSRSPQNILLRLLDPEDGSTMLLDMLVTTVLTSEHSITSHKICIFINTAVMPQILIHDHDHKSQPWTVFSRGWIHTHIWAVGGRKIVLKWMLQKQVKYSLAQVFVIMVMEC
jgi:hypothetical protein